MYLITGCCGFIGSHLTEYYLKKNIEIIGIDSMNNYYDITQKYKNLEILNTYSNFKFYKNNILEFDLKKINIPTKIIHLASYAGVRNSIINPQLYFNNNIQSTIILLEYCKCNNIKYFYFASSSSVYGLNKKIPFEETDELLSPNSPYAVSKITQENIAKLYTQLYRINTVGFRFFTVYGERGRPDMAYYKFIKLILEGKEIEIYGDGNTYRDYTYIKDIIQGINLLVSKNIKGNNVYNISYGAPIILNDFVNEIEIILNKTIKKKYIDVQKGDVPYTYADISKIKKLGYKPKYNLNNGLKQTIKWMINNI